MNENVTRRIPGATRREMILESATDDFGRYGYAGTTTDLVARSAGISQPYVVRMFGSKEKLFIEVFERAAKLVSAHFRSVIAESEAAGGWTAAELLPRLGRAFGDITSKRGAGFVIMQGNLLGYDPVIGPIARERFIEINRILREEAGLSAEATRGFLAEGMLVNTLISLDFDEKKRDPLLPSLAKPAPTAG